MKLNKKNAFAILLLGSITQTQASPPEDPERVLLDREISSSNTDPKLLEKHNKLYKNINNKNYVKIYDEKPKENNKKEVLERLTEKDKKYIQNKKK